MRDGTSLNVDIRSNTELEAFYRGTYDTGLIDAVKIILDVDKTFLDVGANIGFYTVAIAKWISDRGGRGKVAAFEPVRGNYLRIDGNLACNQLQHIAEVFRFGLSDSQRQAAIVLREDFAQGSTSGNASIPINDDFDKGFVTAPIALRCLDDVWDEIAERTPAVDVVKIDVEGHEDFALRGGAGLLRQMRPTILSEINKPFYVARGVDVDRAFKDVMPDNYVVYRLVGSWWQIVNNLNQCQDIDNVMFVPEERLQLAPYKQLLAH